jgi:hypothetical protein
MPQIPFTHLQSDEPVVNLKLFRDKIGTNCSFILLTKFLMHISNGKLTTHNTTTNTQ